MGILLINVIVDNDFHQTESIFRLFDGLEVQGMDTPSKSTSIPNGHCNGNGTKADTSEPHANGHESTSSQINGHSQSTDGPKAPDYSV